MILVEQTIGYREKSIYIDPIIAAHLFDRLIAESQRDTKTAHNQQYWIIFTHQHTHWVGFLVFAKSVHHRLYSMYIGHTNIVILV